MNLTRTLRPGAAALALLLAPALAAASDWPHLRGARQDGRAVGEAGLPEQIGLELDWRVRLGSGYSGIAVGGERSVTAFAEGDQDFVAAFELATGKELWRRPLNPITKGHDGSDDGPLSTPTILNDHVFMLGADGRLLALALEDGSVAWSKDLPKEFGSVRPAYGFSTSPAAVQGKLAVLTGGPEERALSALDPATGEVLWSVGSAAVSDQMPIAMTLGGREQIVAVSGHSVAGYSPEDGSLLWSHEFDENAWTGSSTPTPAGENRLMIFVSGEGTVISVEPDESGELRARELYRTKALGNSYALPVYREGHLYGFRGQILSCVDAETGERVWRSRPPGGRGLILVEDKLVVFGAGGNVVIADASPEGYRERARIEALDASAYTWPAYAGGRILVRNLEEMAAVRLTAASPTAAEPVAVAEQPAEAAPEPDEGAFAAWVARVEALETPDERAAAVDEYLARHSRSPIVDGDRAMFVYRGDVEDLALQGTMLETTAPVPMERLAGTDFFYRSVAVEPAMRYEYLLVKDYEERIADPRNPVSVPARWGPERSQFTTDGYETAEHLSEPAAGGEQVAAGRLEELEIETAVGKRELRVYLPPGYDDGEERYPLLVVYDGMDWIEKGLMVNTLDRLIGDSVRPVVVAFLGRVGQWWLEAGGSQTAEYVEALAKEIVPHLAETYRLSREPGSHAAMGALGYGVTALYAALEHPEIFGMAALQSPQVGLGSDDAVRELLAGDSAAKIRVYLDWNRNEPKDPDSGFDLHDQSIGLAEVLMFHGIDFAGGEARDSFGWASWRSRTDRILEAFFPMS